jgi:polysaccharide export outer membrane protein
MRKSYIVNSFLLLFILFISAGLFSCSSTKKIKYFQDIPDSGQLKQIAKAEYEPLVIQSDDILTILIQTLDPQSTAIVNMGNVPSQAVGSALTTNVLSQVQTSAGYLVDKEGDVTIPVLGKIKVAGSSTSQAADLIKAEAIKFYKDPTIIVRFANFKVNVTGEVLKPGVYVLPNEKVSILDAIALAGDLTIFGKRENVLLIRQNSDGTKTPYRVNLTKSDLMSSKYYYLQQNDIIYVEPRKAKSDATDASQQKYITLAGALLSIILVLAYRVK